MAAANFEYSFSKFGNEGKDGLGLKPKEKVGKWGLGRFCLVLFLMRIEENKSVYGQRGTGQ